MLNRTLIQPKGGPVGACTSKSNARETHCAGVRALGDAVLVLKPLAICLR